MTQFPPPLRPHLARRIGVTGARSLRADQTERIEHQLRELFAAVAENIAAYQQEPSLREAYAKEPARLLFLSPLARGGATGGAGSDHRAGRRADRRRDGVRDAEDRDAAAACAEGWARLFRVESVEPGSGVPRGYAP